MTVPPISTDMLRQLATNARFSQECEALSSAAEQLDTAHQNARLMAARMAEVERERDLAIAHDSQPYPTAESYEKASAALHKHRDDAKRLRAAIQRALDDEESGKGWGPDVTVCAYLRQALAGSPETPP